MTLSDSDDVQTISSGSDDNKEREKKTQGKGKLLQSSGDFHISVTESAISSGAARTEII